MCEIRENKCRTCLKTKAKLKPLNSKAKRMNVDKTYMELLKYVIHLEILSDGEENKLEYGICFKCCRRVRDAYMFIKQVQKCNIYFLNDSKASDALEEVEINNTLTSGADSFSVIKEEQEIPHNDISLNEPKEEINLDDTSNSVDDNCDDLPLSMYISEKAHQGKDDLNPFNVFEIKTEHKNYPEDFQPMCILHETPLTNEKEDQNSKNRFYNSKSKYDDPLDSEGVKDENDIDDDEDNKEGNKDEDENDDVDNELDNNEGTKNEDINDDDVVNNKNKNNKSKKTFPENDDKMLPVKCDECEKIFANSLLLNRHKKDTHIPDELKIQCPKCPVRFSRRYNMYAHMRSFHKTETVRAHQIQPRKLVKTDICEQCNRAYSDKYKLMAHIKNKHGPESQPKKQKQPPKRYLCTLCGLTCCSQSNLDIHYRRHTGEKPYKCEFCSRAYARLYDVQVHRRSHTGETPFKCTVCEKAFKRSNKLKIHMRTHTNERPYKCTQCEKAFKQSKDLNIHKRTHTGERPYKCNVCHSTFTQSNSLKMHQTKTNHYEGSMSTFMTTTSTM